MSDEIKNALLKKMNFHTNASKYRPKQTKLCYNVRPNPENGNHTHKLKQPFQHTTRPIRVDEKGGLNQGTARHATFDFGNKYCQMESSDVVKKILRVLKRSSH